jgi:hypothetical protein
MTGGRGADAFLRRPRAAAESGRRCPMKLDELKKAMCNAGLATAAGVGV